MKGSRGYRRPCPWLVLLATLAVWGEAFAGTIVTRELASKTLGRTWSYNVYLPTGYEGSAARYPVLWLLHGNAQNYASWAANGRIQAIADSLIASGEIPATIIVMPDAGTTWYVDRKEPMETAIVRELIPHVDAAFRTIAARTGRVVAGLSMGGYGTMRLAMKYPEMFAAAALLSPAVYDDPPANSAARRVGVFGSPDYDPAVWKALSHQALWSAYQTRQLPVPMYVVSGDDDEYLIESTATQFYALLRAHKHPAELRIVDGAHTWAVWSATIGDAMKYMFRYTVGSADSSRQQLLTTGKLRAGINAGNALTRVVGAQMARELARRLGAEAVLIEYPTPGAVTEGVGKDWDVAFIAADPERTGAIAFTPAYVELDATYLVREASPIRAVTDADRAGARIATGRTSAYTLVLRRELARAELVYPTEQEAIAGLQAGTITALAGLRFNLLEIAGRVPGLRVLPGNITRAQQAIALPKGNTAALAYVTSFVADVKANGFVAGAIRQTGFTGARVAP